MEDENSNRGRSIKIITQKSSNEILLKAIQDDKSFLLSEKVEETLIMFQKVRALYIDWGSAEKVIAILQKAPYNLPYRTAWDYAQRCPQLFSCVARSITRDFYIDIHLEKIEKTYRMAEAIGDTRSMAAADKNRADALKNLLGSNQAIDKDMLRLPDILAGFHPEWFPSVPAMDSAEFLKIKQLYTKKRQRQRAIELDAEDVDFEDI